MDEAWRRDADKFWAKRRRYRQVGALDTESFGNPHTSHLAEWAQADLPRAYAALKSADMDALALMTSAESEDKLEEMTDNVQDTLASGGNVQGYAMGSPKRVGDILQNIWKREHAGTRMTQRFNSYGTGGDVSSTVPVRGVEDHPEYGARQMRANGLREQDLAICFVEGGETPSVLGAVQEAAKITKRQALFAYCNRDEQLHEIADVADVHDNPRIDRYSFAVGPMALAGSTRMQASTVLQLMIGAALFNLPMDSVKRFVDMVAVFDFSPFMAFTEAETETYQQGEFTLRRAHEYAAATLSDSTEWSPTWSVRCFENYNPEYETQDDDVSMTYMAINGTRSHEEARAFLYGRAPEILDWMPDGIAGAVRFAGLDISEAAIPKRFARLGGRPMHDFNILKDKDEMLFQFKGLEHRVPVGGMHPHFQNVLLKLILNTHSTLMMGRLGKYEQNLMSFVNSTLNYKLIDRSARLIREKFRREGLEPPSYQESVYKIYEVAAANRVAAPVPLAVAALKAQRAP